MTHRSDRRPDTPMISAVATRCRLTYGNRPRGFHQGQSNQLLANRPVIVTQSFLCSSALQFRGSPYSSKSAAGRRGLPRSRTLPARPLWIEGLGTRPRLDDNRCSIAKDFRKAVHELCGVIPHGDDRVRAVLLGMLTHKFIGFLSGLFTKVCVDSDVSAKERLEAPKEISDDRSRSNRDTSHNAKVANNLVAGKRKCRCNHCVLHRFSPNGCLTFALSGAPLIGASGLDRIVRWRKVHTFSRVSSASLH